MEARGICPALLVSLEGVANPNGPDFRADPVGYLQAVMYPENRRGLVVQQYDTGAGHKLDVRVKNLQRGVFTDARDTQSCVTSAGQEYQEETVQVTLYTEVEVTLAADYLELLCTEASQRGAMRDVLRAKGATTPDFLAGAPNTATMSFFGELIASKLNALRARINRTLLTKQAANFGTKKTNGSANAKLLPFWKEGSYDKVNAGLVELRQDFRAGQLMGTPMIFGFDNFAKFNDIMQFGCCNNGGFAWDKMAASAPYNYFEDHFASSILGTNQFGVLAPGAVQMITFNKFRGARAGQHGEYFHFTFSDPFVPGLRYDATLKYTYCKSDNTIASGGTWTLFIGLNYDLYFALKNKVKAGDLTFGNNGTFRYIAGELDELGNAQYTT